MTNKMDNKIKDIVREQLAKNITYNYIEELLTTILRRDTEDILGLYFLIRRIYSVFGLLELKEKYFVSEDEILEFYKFSKGVKHKKEKVISFMEKVGKENISLLYNVFSIIGKEKDIKEYFQIEDHLLLLRELARDYETSLYLGLSGRFKQAIEVLRNSMELMLTIFVKEFIESKEKKYEKLYQKIKDWENFNWGLPPMQDLLEFVDDREEINQKVKLYLQFLREMFNSATHTRKSKILETRSFKHLQNPDIDAYFNEWFLLFVISLLLEYELFLAILKHRGLGNISNIFEKSIQTGNLLYGKRIEYFLVGCHDYYEVDDIQMGYFIDFDTGKGIGVYKIEDLTNDNNQIQRISEILKKEAINYSKPCFKTLKRDNLIIGVVFHNKKPNILKVVRISDLVGDEHLKIEEEYVKRNHKILKDGLKSKTLKEAKKFFEDIKNSDWNKERDLVLEKIEEFIKKYV